MSRIIKTQSGAREREKALRLIGSALRAIEYIDNDANLLDIASFIAITLQDIENSVLETCVAWERRDYWVKADQFRSEWNWVGEAKTKLIEGIRRQDQKLIGEVTGLLRKRKAILEGIIKPKRNIDYSGFYSQFQSRFG